MYHRHNHMGTEPRSVPDCFLNVVIGIIYITGCPISICVVYVVMGYNVL